MIELEWVVQSVVDGRKRFVWVEEGKGCFTDGLALKTGKKREVEDKSW